MVAPQLSVLPTLMSATEPPLEPEARVPVVVAAGFVDVAVFAYVLLLEVTLRA